MAISVSITEQNVFLVLWNFLTAILPPGTPIVQGIQNRVSEPANTDYVVMWALYRTRLATNVDTYIDCAFTGTIATNFMTVSTVKLGTIGIGNALFGVGVAPGTTIAGQTSGPIGGSGEYTVSIAQTVASGTLASGIKSSMQSTQMTVQLDVHGPSSGDNAQIISTLFRDDTATAFFQPATCNFTGSIAGTVLTVAEIASGDVRPLMQITGPGILATTIISQQLTGNPGDVGTYTISPAQNVTSEAMRAIPAFDISPLYADDPVQLLFENAEQQMEERYSISAVVQINPAIVLPQQFFDRAVVTLNPV